MPDEPIVLENQYLVVTIDPTSGMLRSITHKISGIITRVDATFMVYRTRKTIEKSGAYLFLPDDVAQPLKFGFTPRIFVSKGPVFDEVQVILPEIVHIIRLKKNNVNEGNMLEGIFFLVVVPITNFALDPCVTPHHRPKRVALFLLTTL